ncbi:MAG: hypothetical protein AB7G75_06410 [Candidatus Binatia bacterium]
MTYRTAVHVITICTFLGLTVPAWGQGVLENPQPLTIESGIGVVSGWHCNANLIEIQFDSFDRLEAAYGTARGDTQATCGDTNNGYGLLWNYNLLGTGQHTVRAFADGVEFASATFTVVTLGQEFVRGASATASTSLFEIGQEVRLQWQESKQNFVIIETESFDPTQLLASLVGTYSGTWTSASGTGGALSVTFAQSGSDLLPVVTFTLTNTGCAESGMVTGINFGEAIFDGQLSDGSLLRFSSRGTDDVQAFGGSFSINTGACTNTEGVFTIVKQ